MRTVLLERPYKPYAFVGFACRGGVSLGQDWRSSDSSFTYAWAHAAGGILHALFHEMANHLTIVLLLALGSTAGFSALGASMQKNVTGVGVGPSATPGIGGSQSAAVASVPAAAGRAAVKAAEASRAFDLIFPRLLETLDPTMSPNTRYSELVDLVAADPQKAEFVARSLAERVERRDVKAEFLQRAAIAQRPGSKWDQLWDESLQHLRDGQLNIDLEESMSLRNALEEAWANRDPDGPREAYELWEIAKKEGPLSRTWLDYFDRLKSAESGADFLEQYGLLQEAFVARPERDAYVTRGRGLAVRFPDEYVRHRQILRSYTRHDVDAVRVFFAIRKTFGEQLAKAESFDMLKRKLWQLALDADEGEPAGFKLTEQVAEPDFRSSPNLDAPRQAVHDLQLQMLEQGLTKSTVEELLALLPELRYTGDRVETLFRVLETHWEDITYAHRKP